MLSTDSSPVDELLSTKLEIPLLGSRIVQRQRLTHLLQLGMARRLSLIVAPTGYGKTTLLGEWVSSLSTSDWRIAWVSLDTFDNTPLRLWSYITASLHKAYPKLRFHPQQLVQQPHYDPQDFSVLHPLLNEIAQIPAPVCLILDDYQVITDEAIHAGLAYLIEHLPTNLHLVIASRAAPPIPLARLRAQRQLLEISAHDLAFTLPEAKTFLGSVMDLEIPPAQIGSLLEATEGWITGLQLAALSCQGQSCYPTIRLGSTLSGSRQILDYLSEEVFSRLDQSVREFLLTTSILTELSAPLCDAVFGRSDSAEILAQVEQANLFIVCLDDQGGWYRYHTLFAEALQRLLQRAHPAQIPELHRRACAWLMKHGYPEQAVSHALAAGDLEHAAEIVESCAMQAIVKFDLVSIIQWISRFSDELIDRRPRLGIYYALANFYLERVDLMEAKLQLVEHTLDKAQADHLPNRDEQLLRWQMMTIRTVADCQMCNFERGIPMARELLENPLSNDLYFDGFLRHALASAYDKTGNFKGAEELLAVTCERSMSRNLQIEYMHDAGELGRIYKDQGYLHKAEEIFQQAVDFALQAELSFDVISLARTGLVEIAVEHNAMEEADRYFNEIRNVADQIGTRPSIWGYLEIMSVRLAKYYLARNDLENARLQFFKALKNYHEHHQGLPYLDPELIDLQVQIWLAFGETDTALDWLLEQIKTVTPSIKSNLNHQIALAKVYLAQNQPELALGVLNRLESHPRETTGNERAIKILAYQALAEEAIGEEALALRCLEQSLELAAPEEYIRIFLEQGAAMETLLAKFLRQTKEKPAPALCHENYAKKLAAAFHQNLSAGTVNPQAQTASSPKTTTIVPLHEPLSQRELEVLEMLIEGKSMKEVASALMISINTAKAHAKNIYRKLGAHDRKALIQKAAELGIRGEKG